MPPDRRQRLDALGFVWDPLAAQWDEGVHFLEIYRQREGHYLVPTSHREQGYRLGQWVGVQRTAQDTLSPERRARLDALGFVWDPLAAQWDKGVHFLEFFREREGHCRVPDNHREEAFRLGGWVREQRTAQDTLSPERRARLDALGFVWKVR